MNRLKNFIYNFDCSHPAVITTTVLICVVCIVVLIKYRQQFIIKGLIDDTLKRWDPVTKKMVWSRTSLTMLTAWVSCVSTFIYDTCKNGINEFTFGAMITVALGSKLTDAWSKKLSPTDTTSTPSNT